MCRPMKLSGRPRHDYDMILLCWLVRRYAGGVKTPGRECVLRTKREAIVPNFSSSPEGRFFAGGGHTALW